MHDRPGWDPYFLGIAAAVSKRGDCSRRQVGAVVVNHDHRIVGTGYNGVGKGLPGCIDQPCNRVRAAIPCPGYSDCRSVHAESNAIVQTGVREATGSVLYCTDEPCESCWKTIRVAGIDRVIWGTPDSYESDFYPFT